MGRGAQGVRGIRLEPGDAVVGMVVARPDSQILTVCENGSSHWHTLLEPER